MLLLLDRFLYLARDTFFLKKSIDPAESQLNKCHIKQT